MKHIGGPLLKVTMIIPNNLKGGGGNEKSLLYLARHRPDWVDLTIIQTDDRLREVISQEFVLTMLNGGSLATIPSPNHRLLFMRRKLPLLLLENFLISPLVLFWSRSSREKVAGILNGTEVVYTFNNNYSWLVPRGVAIVGVTDTVFVWGVMGTVFSKLASLGLVYPRILGFHLLRPLTGWKNRHSDFLLPNGVDTNAFLTSVYTRSRIRMLFVSRMERKKGILDLLQAWDLVNKMRGDVELHIVGRGSLEQEVSAIADRYTSVIYHGGCSEQDLIRIYRDSDVFILPSRGETFGNVIVEALSCGLYIIAGENLRGNFDDLEGHGFLEYCQYDSVNLSNAIVRSINNIEKIRLNRSSCHQYAVEYFDWGGIAKKFYENLRSIAGQSQGNEIQHVDPTF